jgi:hypothetical protein
MCAHFLALFIVIDQFILSAELHPPLLQADFQTRHRFSARFCEVLRLKASGYGVHTVNKRVSGVDIWTCSVYLSRFVNTIVLSVDAWRLSAELQLLRDSERDKTLQRSALAHRGLAAAVHLCRV